jgi:hypothetical protein
MPQHQHVLVTGSGAGGDQRLEGGLQPPPATLRAPDQVDPIITAADLELSDEDLAEIEGRR